VRIFRLLAIVAALAAMLAAPAVIGAQERAASATIARIAPAEPSARAAVRTAVNASASATSLSVTVGNYFYRPDKLTAHVGDTVVWTNKGNAPEGHTVTGDGLDSGVFKEGQTFSHKFSKAGTVSYVCTLHPNMKGSVAVLARSSSSGSDTDQGSADTNAARGQTDSGGGGTTGSSDARAIATDTSGSSNESGSLPATGSDSLLLSLYGLVLIELGLVIRMISRPRAK
jgi:plastocyanin